MARTQNFSADTLASRWRTTPQAIRNLIDAGKLTGERDGSVTRVSPAAVEEFERQQAGAAANARTSQPRPTTGAVGGTRYAYTVETLAKIWGVSAGTVRNLVNTGELKALRVGRQIRIRPEHVEEYELRQAVAEPEAEPPRPRRETWIPPRQP